MPFIDSSKIRRDARRIGALAVLATFGCSQPQGPAGSYKATSFTSTSPAGVARNELASGASINLVLAPDGTTSGRVHTEASTTTPALDEDLTGTWTSRGSTVDLDHRADTFLRDIVFAVHKDSLIADHVISGTRVQVTLTRD